MNGKGSKQRPLSVSYETYSDNFDAIFRKKQNIPIKELPNGDQYIEIPDEVLKMLDWKEGDEIIWEEDDKGGYLAKKKNK